ncbi:2322_t:CDS:1 [Dentiscutata heterogama]|uniref:2322_t:CDS:1 n=1 Tax=Dentiscutata heterogama TaxID=1316150 RepID=A0ACA9MJ94_9GLOM|nr:2322_t:CDS:1 [Dentiscutata heterogama]
MPKYSKKHTQMIQLTANREVNKKSKKVIDILQSLDGDNFDNVLKLIYSIRKEEISETPIRSNEQLIEPIQGLSSDEKEETSETPIRSNEQLIELIQGLSSNEKEDAIKLLENMKYPRGKNKEKIISQYL